MTQAGYCLGRRFSLVTSFAIVSSASLLFVHSTVAAEPYVPTSDDEVLETLPRSLLASRDELTSLRQQLAANPNSPDIALKVANRFVQLGNAEGDPRYYGYARAAIGPWWEAANPPPAILRLRAKLKDKEHRYDAALADLRQLLKQEPRDAQGWIEVANILRVQGEYEEAWKACESLSAFAGEIPQTLCRAPLQAATGNADEAYDSLAKILPMAKEKFPSTVEWILTVKAQIAQALGRNDEAEQHMRASLERYPDDRYQLRAYGDFLLDNNREREAVELLRDYVSDNGILLCAAIAAQRSGNDQLAAEWKSLLAEQFEDLRRRGSQPHRRFEARHELELMNEPNKSLEIALANWEEQKETRDTRNVLEAAIAANKPEAAKPVLEFLTRHGTEDVVLQKLVKELESLE